MAFESVIRGVIAEPEMTRVLPDCRADDGRRRVHLAAGRILIERRVNGIDMRVGVPTAAYAGVALSISDGTSQRVYRIELAHRDRELGVVLQTTNEQEGVAEWTRWARFFALPRMVERHDGSLVTVLDTDESLERSGCATPRRRNASLSKRRPRFGMRRRVGNITAMALVHGGEREIICYE
jgi:hypothetical protein